MNLTRHIPSLPLLVALLGSATLGLSQSMASDLATNQANRCASSTPTSASCRG